MQVEVANVAAELAELCITDHGIGVCAVDVNLTTGFVNSVTNVDDGFFINAVGRWVGDHQGTESVAGFFNLRG